MCSSQERAEKCFKYIDATFKELALTQNDEKILQEYKSFLLEEVEAQKEEELIVKNSFDQLSETIDPVLDLKHKDLEDKVNVLETNAGRLREDIDNLTIQSIARKESIRIEYEETKHQIEAKFNEEARQLKEQLQIMKAEHAQKEQNIKDEIAIEVATRNAQIGDLKAQLQRQIEELNTTLFGAQNDHKNLLKELNTLKNPPAPKTVETSRSSNQPYNSTNSISFNNDYLKKSNYINVPKNVTRPESTLSAMSEYSTTETYLGSEEYMADSNKTNVHQNQKYFPINSDTNTAQFYAENIDPRNHNKNVGPQCSHENHQFTKNQAISREAEQKYAELDIKQFSLAENEKETNKSKYYKDLNDQELSYYAAEFSQFDASENQPVLDLYYTNKKLDNMVPNPCNREIAARNTYNPKRTEVIKQSDSVEIIDFDTTIEKNSCDIESISIKMPTVFRGTKRKNCYYSKYVPMPMDQSTSTGTTLNKISMELEAKNRKR